MAKALTTRAVEALKPNPEKRVEHPDPALSGLYLVIQPSAAKSWALRYRHRGRPKKLTLGRWPVMGVADARYAATAALEAIDHGADPAGEKQAERRRSVEDRDRDTMQALFMQALFDQFDRRHLSKLRTRKTIYREVERHALSRWGDMDVRDISKRDILDLLDEIMDSGREVSANRLRGYLQRFFNWLIERGVIDVSPVQGVKRPAKETTRDRVLNEDEMRWLWLACKRLGEPWGPFTQMLILTGQRRAEVAGMRDSEVSGGVWQLSAQRTKNARAHTVPLPEAALSTIDRPDRVSDNLVFSARGSVMSGFSRGRQHVQAAMKAVAEEERGHPVEIANWTFHDLRRSAATHMARLGTPIHVVEAILNHTSGALSGVAGIYNRHAYDGEKATALTAWARYLEANARGGADNVVRISERAT